MRAILNYIRRSFYLQLIAVFLVLIIPLYFMSYFFYSLGSETLVREELHSRQKDLDYAIQSLEQQIEGALQLQFDALNGTDINMVHILGAGGFDYRVNSHVAALRRQLSSIQVGNNILTELVALFPAMEREVSSIHGFGERTILPAGLLEHEDITLFSGLRLEGGKLVSEVYYPSFRPQRTPPYFYAIRAEFSKENISQKFYSFRSPPHRGIFLVFLEDERDGALLLADQQAQADFFLQAYEEQATQSVQTIDYKGEPYYVLRSQIGQYPIQAYHYIQESEIVSLLTSGRRRLIGFTVVAVLLILAFITYLYRRVQQPVGRLVSAFQQVDSGNLDYRIASKQQDEFGYLFEQFDLMLESINQLIDTNYSQVLMLKEAELHQLQSQINPHFLYNSFFILHRLIKSKDWEHGEAFSSSLGTYFNYITRSESVVFLQEEYTHAAAYAHIQSQRFRGRVFVEMEEIPARFQQWLVPKLILQPVLENVFEHAFSEMLGEGYLRLRVTQKEDGLLLSIDDNGTKVDDSLLEFLRHNVTTERSGTSRIGLANIHRRIQIYFGKNSGLSFSRSALGGLQVTITLIEPRTLTEGRE